MVTPYICTSRGGYSREGPEGMGTRTGPTPRSRLCEPQDSLAPRSSPAAGQAAPGQRAPPGFPRPLYACAGERGSATFLPLSPLQGAAVRACSLGGSGRPMCVGASSPPPHPVPKAFVSFRPFPAPRSLPAPSPLAWALQSRRRGGRRRKMAAGIGGEAAAGAAAGAAAAVMQTRPSAARAAADRG